MAKRLPGILLIAVLSGTAAAAWALYMDFGWALIFAAYVMGGQAGLIACILGYLSGARSR